MARSAIALWWDAANAGTNLMMRSADLLIASTQVISHRSDTINAALRDPARADHSELRGMVTEKIEAFTHANLSLLQEMGQANVDLLAMATRFALGGGLTPIGLTAEAARATRRANRAAERVMRPIHDRATANARRLNRKKHRAG